MAAISAYSRPTQASALAAHRPSERHRARATASDPSDRERAKRPRASDPDPSRQVRPSALACSHFGAVAASAPAATSTGRMGDHRSDGCQRPIRPVVPHPMPTACRPSAYRRHWGRCGGHLLNGRRVDLRWQKCLPFRGSQPSDEPPFSPPFRRLILLAKWRNTCSEAYIQPTGLESSPDPDSSVSSR